MDKLPEFREAEVGKAFFQEILHRFDIVVGPAFDFLDPGRVFRREVSVQGTELREEFRIYSGKLGEREFAQGDEIFDFHLYPVTHQGALGEEGGEFLRLSGVSAVDGRDGQQWIHA